MLNAYDMALGAARVASLTFGGAQDGDLNTDLGCVWSIDGPEMMHARCHTLMCARAARFDTPLDGVFANVRDPAGFEQDTALSRRLGYRGRKLIHPSQIEPCNRLYAPSQKELDYYARVLEAFDKALAAGQRLDHGRRQDDRRGDGQRRAARARRSSGAEEGGLELSRHARPWPGIHVLAQGKTWMAGTSPAMTTCDSSASANGCSTAPASELRGLAPSERGGAVFEQLDGRRPAARLVDKADRYERAVLGAHAGDPARLPVLLSEHVADHRNLLDHALMHAFRLELGAVAARTQQPLREKPRAAALAAPDGRRRKSVSPLIHIRSSTTAAAVPP